MEVAADAGTFRSLDPGWGAAKAQTQVETDTIAATRRVRLEPDVS